MAAGRTVATLRTTVIFALLGPVAAAAVILLLYAFGVLRFGLPIPEQPYDYWAATVVVVVFSYIFGFVPGLLTGLGGSFLSPMLKSPWLWALASLVLGVVATCAWAAFFMRGEARGATAFASWYVYIGSAVVGSLASAVATLRLRPGPPQPLEPPETEYMPQEP